MTISFGNLLFAAVAVGIFSCVAESFAAVPNPSAAGGVPDTGLLTSAITGSSVAEIITSLSAIEKYGVPQQCRATIAKWKGHQCFKMPVNNRTELKALSSTFTSYCESSCSASCNDSRVEAAKEVINNCVTNCPKPAADLARGLISVFFFARDMACTQGEDGQYCMAKVLDKLSEAARVMKTKMSVDTCGDTTTIIIKPFKLSSLPRNLCCEDACVKKFVVGSYAWIKMLNDKLGATVLNNDFFRRYNVPNKKEVDTWADELNAKCGTPIVDKECPIGSNPKYATAATPPGYLPAEGTKYFNETPGNITSDSVIGNSVVQSEPISVTAGSSQNIILNLGVASAASAIVFSLFY